MRGEVDSTKVRSNAPFRTFLRKVANEVPFLGTIPLFGNAPPFEWDKASQLLSEKFGLGPFEIQPGKQLWLEAVEVHASLGRNALVTELKFLPLSSPLYFGMARADVAKLTSWLLGKKKFSSEILQEGFYRYLLLESLDTISQVAPLQKLTPELLEESSLPETGAFSVEIEIRFEGKSAWGKLFIPEAFRKEWIAHFSAAPSEYVPSDTARSTELVLGIKTGSVNLRASEWEKLKEGDFLLLDKNSYDARKHQGVALFTLGNTPLFQVKIKHNQIELLDYAFYYEDPMADQLPPIEGFQAANEEVSPLKDLPLHVTVEIGRLRITLDELMHLNPGNVLELPIHPDQGVTLTINGQKVGRAELLHLGETLGIRLLEIGR